MPTSIRKLNHIQHSSATLSQNGNFQFAQKHALCHYTANAIYTFIPKNGCTSLRASLANANGFLDDITKDINWTHNNTYTFKATLRDLACAEYTYTILRCPYERMASLFLDKFIDKTPVAWSFYRYINNAIDLDNLTITSFIEQLSKQPELINANIHWRKQTDFLIYKKYDSYFDLANYENIIKTLKKKTNLNLIDTRSVTNHGRESYHKEDSHNFSETPIHKLRELKKRGALPTTNSMYTQELKNTVKKIYQSDFQLRNLVL